MYKITKEFHFSASHQLLNLPSDHSCARLHGHNYIVMIELTSETLNQFGFVRDYQELSLLKNYIDNFLDHRHLNEVFNNDSVTAEFLAKYLYDWCKPHFPEVSAIKVSETPKTWAEYRP
ncbi:6-pyruvoyl tetrahydropterin synthase family protein [Bartonella sp. DGB1]|uniref:6-pyruvoyl trahydropterin synthase family protein n=1 Tax=Bartonella sp. DGB1 TaxID=3239807 RepID=UPI0035235BF5